jgi:hypothetical protein
MGYTETTSKRGNKTKVSEKKQSKNRRKQRRKKRRRRRRKCRGKLEEDKKGSNR